MGVIYEKKNRTAYVTIDRPQAHNAIDPETALALLEAWEDFRDDHACICAIITGSGDKSFCAGLDLGTTIPLMTGARAPENEAEKTIAENPGVMDAATLRNFELHKPVIAAVNGFAIAGGMEIVQATDIRIAAKNARFGLQEAKWGLFPNGGSTVRLPRQIPYCRAMEIMLTGELIDAGQALELGFVNRVVPADKLMETAEQMAAKITANGPLSLRYIKAAVLQSMGRPLEEGLAMERAMGDIVFKSKDAAEGPRAFLEKRKPNFIGE